jgi:hypothetical protein
VPGEHLEPVPPRPGLHIPDLHPVAVCEYFEIPLPDVATEAQAAHALARALLGGDLDPKALTELQQDVVDGVRALESEVGSGRVMPTRRVIRGRPLAEWLSLDDVACVLRAWRATT